MSFIKHIFKRHYFFLIIFLIAFFLRAYRIDYLTTFGHDQGIDFSTVREMILMHHLTLVGIKVSLADFFQGPLYLYMLLPFFWIMNMNILAGPIAAVVISLITICVLYVVLIKISDIKAGCIGAIIFAVSPQFIQFGNTPLYQHFTPFFYVICIYFLYRAVIVNNKKILSVFLVGLSSGLSMELHFLSISLTLTALIVLLVKRTDKLKSTLLFLLGLFVSLAPTIIFELKHNFLNTNYLFQYLTSNSGSRMDLLSRIDAWINGASAFFGAENKLGGILILVFVFYILAKINKSTDKKFNFIRNITFLLLAVNIIFSLILSTIGWWYPLPFWVASLILLSIYFAKNLANRFIFIILALIIFSNLFFSVSIMGNNHGYYMVNGWSLRKIEDTTDVILTDAVNDKGNFNVMSAFDNTRTYQLRYALELRGKIPGKITDYNQNNSLYIVSSGNLEKTTSSNVWELQQFSPFRFGNSWDMGDNIFLYRIDKIR